MKTWFLLAPWLLLTSATAFGGEREWQCLSALQEELTRSNCVGRSHPVGGAKQEGSSGSFTCGFLHCKGEGALVGANYYSFQNSSNEALCFHLEGKTYSFRGVSNRSGRISLPGISDQVTPNQSAGVCRIPSPLGLHIAKNNQGQILQFTQVKAQKKNASLKEGSDSEIRLCDDSVRTKIGAAAFALGYKLIRSPKDVDQGRYLGAFALCRGIPEMKAFQEGTASAKAAAAHLK